VQPSTQYQFSVHFKTDELEDAGGLAFVVRDELTGVVYLTTETLKKQGSWREVAAFRNGSGSEAGERADGADSGGECHAGASLDGRGAVDEVVAVGRVVGFISGSKGSTALVVLALPFPPFARKERRILVGEERSKPTGKVGHPPGPFANFTVLPPLRDSTL